MKLHDDLVTDTVLRSLDAAPAGLTDSDHLRAEATLARILATAPEHVPEQSLAPSPASRRYGRKLVLIPLAAAGLAVGSLVVPGLGHESKAYASWTAKPTPVSGKDLARVEAACQKQLRHFRNVPAVRPVLAERRGDFVAVLLRSDDPDTSVPCVALNPPGTTKVEQVHASAGGSDGPPPQVTARQFFPGSIAEFGAPQLASSTDGVVGSEVIGVTIHAGHLTVAATVKNGRYAAWWPGAAFEAGPLPPNGQGGPREILTYDLTFADGTTRMNAQPPWGQDDAASNSRVSTTTASIAPRT